MRILTTASRRLSFDTPRRARAVAVLLAVAGLYAFAAAGPATAQGTYYADLNAAVPGLASELVQDDRLAGKKVLVNAHDFFEEGEDGRNLPLSATLRERFRRELSNRGVQVFTLPEGSEDEMVILHGRWRELSEPGDRSGPRPIELTVYLVERTAAGQQLLPAAGGRVDAVEEALLTPDLASWGRHVVKELERRVGGRGRRVVHVGDLWFDGVAEPERLQRYLVRRWLRPAFSQSRLFRLASGAGEGSGGALHMDVFVHEKDVEVVLDIEEQGVQVATADFTMTRDLIPARFLGGGTKPAPDDDLVADVEKLLRECAGHAHGGRWREAWGCYGEVLERDAGNRDAERGREEIERGYGERMRAALGRREFAQAREIVGELATLATDSARVRTRVGAWKSEIEGAERDADERRVAAEAKARRKREEAEARRKAEEERRRAEARRIAELTPEMVVIEGGCFLMGSPESETGRNDDERQHEVCVESFSIGKYEVTRGQYARFVGETGRATGDGCWTYESGGWEERSGRSWRTPGYGQEDTHPVVCVSHDEAVAYARWLSRETGRRFRLPTEVEWEYAARAGTETSRPWGDDPSRACGYANVGDRTLKERYPDWKWSIHACRDGYAHTAPVGSFEANGWGLHDMLGNAWEWTCSEWDEGYGGAEQRCASGGAGGRRVRRGGSWYNTPGGVRAAYRSRSGPGYRNYDLGFRLVQD